MWLITGAARGLGFDDRLGRNFTTQSPNQIWLADLTYIPTGEGCKEITANPKTK